MLLECSFCHQKVNLPDDKLPIGRPFSFTCPYCKNKNTATINSLAPDMPAPAPDGPALAPSIPTPAHDGPATASMPVGEEFTEAQYSPSPPPAPPTPLRAPSSNGDSEISNPSFKVEEDEFDSTNLTMAQILSGEVDERPKALIIYDDFDVAEDLEKRSAALGFQPMVAMNLRDAAKQLKFISFSIVLLQENYFGASLSSNHLLRAIQTMDGPSRRGMLVVLISPTLTTLDDLLAFSLSIDAVINTSELSNIERMLISTVGRAKKFYAVYREVLAEHGLD